MDFGNRLIKSELWGGGGGREASKGNAVSPLGVAKSENPGWPNLVRVRFRFYHFEDFLIDPEVLPWNIKIYS